MYILALDPNFGPFIGDIVWGKKTKDHLHRGLEDDADGAANRQTKAQKSAILDLMLGQIANYCPVISRNTIVKNASSQ